MDDTSSGPVPNPPRFWWLKRFIVLGVVALLALIGLRLYWGHAMSQRLEAAVAAIEAKGEPIRFEDMLRDPVSDQDNAAYFFMEALRTWPEVEPGKTIVETEWYEPPWGSTEIFEDPITDNAAYLAECAEAFALLDQAAAAPQTDWNIQYASPAIDTLLPHLGQSRQLATLIEDAIRRAHEQGNDRLAAHLLERVLDLSDAVSVNNSSMIEFLVGVSIRALCVGEIEPILPTLRVDTNDPKAATPEQLRRIIDRLLDHEQHRKRFTQAFIGARWSDHDTVYSVVDGRIPLQAVFTTGPFLQTPLMLGFSPILERDVLLMLEWNTDMIEAASEADNLHAWRDNLAQRQPIDPQDQSFLLRPLAQIFLPVYGAAARTHYQAQAVLRSTAIALAIKLYEHDHGRRPETLAELVPDYLDEVPLDPLAATPREIGYLPEGVLPMMDNVRTNDPAARDALAERRFAVIYSVGGDGKDDGGRHRFADDGTLIIGFSTDDREDGDEVFHLDASPEPLPQDPEPDSPYDIYGPYGPGGPGSPYSY